LRVLVTGGAGYIGSHACKALAAAGHNPVVYDNLSSGHRQAVKWGPLEVGDVGDHARLTEVMVRRRPEAVMHFAAHIEVGESISDPAKYYGNNVAGTLTLLRAMRQEGVGSLVFSSTCATYGEPTAVPIDEGHRQAPINPYGRSKLMIETILGDFRTAYGLRSLSLRYFNAAGADPDGEIGEDHDPETHLIPLVLRAAAGGGAITIFGDDYQTPDGACIRDYTHVSDIAAAHVLSLKRLAAPEGSPALNLGTGAGLSVKAIIDVARKVTGRPIEVRVGPRRPGDPPVLVADPRRARAELGWRPAHSSPAEIVETAWRRMNAGDR
jgi:UDP-arabinose 4-epimerase